MTNGTITHGTMTNGTMTETVKVIVKAPLNVVKAPLNVVKAPLNVVKATGLPAANYGWDNYDHCRQGWVEPPRKSAR
ncbi:hypothetical protein GNI_045690 [Gregarina niphandrodes]|uniref:Uncharacterized protein n=1 Tax=Gregarina niphandrodes TaxID=110365 RepID=A0A023B9T2_GRENI|nr:hypothetical protein GNI_045690 [Gregarina niphandrodes]EZG76059.1 hypothetical protein GNI_045690 [Gregarina niphandrodes]|eukprot:XP_011129593.1 hypothetical protein GNI_045690 [Gregarina niphandrodes]